MEISKICFRFRTDVHYDSSSKWIGICYRSNYGELELGSSLARFPNRVNTANATFSNRNFTILMIKRKVV